MSGTRMSRRMRVGRNVWRSDWDQAGFVLGRLGGKTALIAIGDHEQRGTRTGHHLDVTGGLKPPKTDVSLTADRP